LVIAALSVNSVSAVPSTTNVGIVSFGPRLSNQARSSALSVPLAAPEVNADRMCGSSRPLEVGMPSVVSALAQPPLTVSSL
jgi:hypothetical protein